uniref:Uncharacterized protein n=1 Tax=Anguilla anguilla TaxID=7936 RepID=A0A0E9TWI3_ANGAN
MAPDVAVEERLIISRSLSWLNVACTQEVIG